MRLKTTLCRLLVLLCLSMTTGLVLPVFAAPAEGEPAEPVVLTVLEQYAGEAAAAAKTYTMSDLKALAESKVVGYQHWKNGSEKIIASDLYATVDSLLADAGVSFGSGDAVTAADPTDFTSTLTYEDSNVYKYYVNEEGTSEVPAAILISWNTGSGTPEDVAKTAYISGSLRFAYGISEQQYADQSAQGKRLASNVVTPTVTHPERTVLTVYEQTEGGEAKAVKTYKPSELAALKTTGTVGYQYWKGGEETILAATEYVTIDSLLTDAGLSFSENDTVQAAAADGFSSKLTYAESQSNKYFFTNGSKTEVPAALALSWSTGKGALEEVAATAKNTGNIRFAYGVSQEQFDAKTAAGKRLVSNVASVTVIHAAACTHPTTEVVNAKPATCTEDGYTGDLVCTVCGVVIGQGEVIPANCPGAKFTDLPAVGNWAHEGIDFAVKHDLFRGTSETTFEPETAMDRAMLVTVLWRLAGQPASSATVPFTDVSAKGYYADALAWAFENGVVRGVTETTFEPESIVTREQITAILFRYAEQKGYDVSARAELTGFSDAASVKSYAKDAMSWAVAVKLIQGTNNGAGIVLDPEGSATRAQVATLLMRFAESLTK